MTSLDAKLFAWHRAKLQYEEARARLRTAMGEFAGEDVLQSLDAEVDRLRDEMSALLAEIDAQRRQRAQGASAGE